MPAAAKPKTKVEEVPKRRLLAFELLTLRRKHAEVYGQEASLKSSLIAIATEAGEGFREVFESLGTVSVYGTKDKQFNGQVPEVNVEKFLALSESKRQKLIDAGIIVMKENWTRADYGRVTPKLF